MVVTKKVQDSQMDSKWQSISTGRAQCPVAEHPAVHLGAKLAYLRPLVVSGQGPGLAVERFDFRRY